MSLMFLLFMVLLVVMVIVIVVLFAVFGASRRDKSKKITMRAVVRDIREEMRGTGNPIMSRSGPVYMAADAVHVVFEFMDGGTVGLKVSNKIAKTLEPGMRGMLTFRNGELISFVVDKT